MKPIDSTRPEKVVQEELNTITGFTSSLYSNQKTEAKSKSELAFIGRKKMEKVRIQLYEYSPDYYSRLEQLNEFDFLKSPSSGINYWLNFHGLHDVNIIQKIGELAELDRLTVRQILDTTQRSRIQEYQNYLFLNVKSILKQHQGEFRVEHMSFILGPHFVISFQEIKGDHFEGIRNRLAEGLGLLRQKKSDYLLIQLIDSILDNYFETIDQINSEVSQLEEDVISNPSQSTLITLETQKHSAQIIRKALGPFKEVLMNIINGHAKLVRDENVRFFKDLTNSATAAIEEIDATLKRLEGLTNIYFASLSHKMNEIMKVLTTVATFFIPLTFIVGVYGMNFDNMPELHYEYGYFIIWGIMVILVIAMVVYFRRKHWL